MDELALPVSGHVEANPVAPPSADLELAHPAFQTNHQVEQPGRLPRSIATRLA
jgi:hypothetical protein